MFRVLEVVQEYDGDGVDASIARPGESRAHSGLIECLLLTAIGGDTAGDLMDLLEEHLGFYDMAVEQLRADLVADAERIGETLVGNQSDPIALSLQQRIGRHGGSHLDGADTLGGDAAALRDTQQIPNALNCRVPISLGILGEQLVTQNLTVRGACHHIGKGPTAVDPEIPLTVAAHVFSHPSTR